MNTIHKVAALAGGQSRLAELCGVSPPAVYQWLVGIRPVPPERCVAIELALGPEWAVERIRPDVSWIRVRDRHWPHPAGRPCLDIAAQYAPGDRR